MPRFAADVMIFAQCEVEAENIQEAREFFARSLGTNDETPDMTVSVASSNGAPVRLINVDPSIGMIGERTGAPYCESLCCNV